MKPNTDKPHRLIGATMTVSGKPWDVREAHGKDRLWVGRTGEDSRQSWPIYVVEMYALDQAAERKEGAAGITDQMGE
jgi:hypothetical protein